MSETSPAVTPAQEKPESASPPQAVPLGKHRRRWEAFVPWLLLADMGVLGVLYTALHAIRHGIQIAEFFSGGHLLLLVLASCLTLYLVGGYQKSSRLSSGRFMAEHLLASAAAAFIVVAVIYSFAAYEEQLRPSRSVVFFTLFVFPALSLTYRTQLGRAYERGSERARLFLVGDTIASRKLEELIYAGQLPFNVQLFDPSEAKSSEETDDLFAAIEKHHAELEAVVLTSPVEALPPSYAERLIQVRFATAPVETMGHFVASYLRVVPLDSVGPDWAFERGFQLSSNASYNRMKRLIDVLLAGTGLLLTWPLILLTALLIRLESPGPAIFRQTRVGKDGERFTLFKLRTMRSAHVDETPGSLYTQKNDQRVTRLGNFLRRTRIDELPQLWNVLSGEMSMIGPRAEWDRLVEGYEQRIPYYNYRHLVKPGISGWAQVNFPYGANDEDTIVKLGYDLYYVQFCSLVLDLSICLKTLYIMLFGKGR